MDDLEGMTEYDDISLCGWSSDSFVYFSSDTLPFFSIGTLYFVNLSKYLFKLVLCVGVSLYICCALFKPCVREDRDIVQDDPIRSLALQFSLLTPLVSRTLTSCPLQHTTINRRGEATKGFCFYTTACYAKSSYFLESMVQ